MQQILKLCEDLDEYQVKQLIAILTLKTLTTSSAANAIAMYNQTKSYDAAQLWKNEHNHFKKQD